MAASKFLNENMQFKSTVPPDFFAKAAAGDSSPDEKYAHQRRMLASALQLPANNRWVADWLFSDNTNTFHKNICIPPEAFENYLSITVQHHFLDVDLVGPLHAFHSQFDNSSGTPNASASSCPFSSTRLHSQDTEFLIVPVAKIGGIVVGYSFWSMMDSVGEAKPTVAFKGRFAFDDATQQFVFVNESSQSSLPFHTDEVLMVMTFFWKGETVRQHHMFVCPLQDYSFFNLPNEVLFMATAEMQTSSRVQQHSSNGSEKSLDIFAQMIDSLIDQNNNFLQYDESIFDISSDLPRSGIPWILDSNGTPTDNIGIPRRPGTTGTSSGAFDMTGISESLLAIEMSLNGNFFGSRSADSVHPGVNLGNVPSIRNVMASMHRSAEARAIHARDSAVQIYFSSVLAVNNDRRFFASKAITNSSNPSTRPISPESSSMDNSSVPNKRPRTATKAKTIAPAIAPARIAPIPVSHLPAAPAVANAGEARPLSAEEKKREERLEAKRRRNRLSAARSNERRKENWRMKRETLASLQQQVQHLTQRREALLRENQSLRALTGQLSP